ncbi:DUF1007 family protein [Aestuariivirga sp.]|uniref:DUF1007 family protein n=1 Tax=Aestuariivirga sp. TaxID=2650926 RepID=UPI0035B31A69
MSGKARYRIWFATSLFLLAAARAEAHPHVWAIMHSTILFTSTGLVRGVAVDWTFDEAYSQVALDGLDADGDGSYSAAELAPLTKVNLSSLKTYGYFVFFRRNGDVQKIGDAIDSSQSYAHGRLTLRFTVPLIRPMDPLHDQIGLKVYDPEYFIDFEYAKKSPVTAAAGMLPQCRIDLTPIPSDSTTDQTRQMLAGKGIDWKPDNNEDFGAMFAQTAMVVCKP